MRLSKEHDMMSGSSPEPLRGESPQISGSLTGRSVAIVGGGILGMSLAWRLRARGADVTLYEGSRKTGGLAVSGDIGPYTWDRFYHVMLLSDSHLQAMLKDLGLDSKRHWGITKTGFYANGQLVSMSNAFEFLRFPPLNLFEKFRLGATIFLASRIKNWKPLEQTLAVDWLRKWSGDSVVDKVWLPLLKSKLGDNYKIASAAFIWAIIARMYAARKAGLKQEMFGYIDGGYETILRGLQAKLDSIGVLTKFESRVVKVAPAGEGVSVTMMNQELTEFDYAVMTIPTNFISTICPDLTEAEKNRLNSVTYQGIICPSLLLKHDLSPYYVTNITDSGAPFTGVIEMTALVDKKNFGGNALVYLPQYLVQDSDYWQKTDDEVFEDCIAALEKMYPDFDRSYIVGKSIARSRQVLPISTLNYSEKLRPGVTTSMQNVFILNSAQIANGTLNVNEAIGLVNQNIDALEQKMRKQAQEFV